MVPRAGTSFVQCFAWSAKRGQMCLVFPTSCAVRLGITGAEHTRPCWYLAGTSFVQCFAWSAQAMYHLPGLVLVLVSQTRANVPSLPYPLRSSLGYHGRGTYSPVLVLCWYLFRAVLRSACTVLRLVRTGHVPTCPCLHLYRYLLCSWTARALYLLPVSLMYLRVRATCPRLYPCTVFLLWVTRAMYVSSCVDSRAVTVSLLPLAWTVCW